jgi:hypothetical protein
MDCDRISVFFFDKKRNLVFERVVVGDLDFERCCVNIKM